MLKRTSLLLTTISILAVSSAHAQTPASTAAAAGTKTFVVFLVNGATVEIKANSMTPDPSGTLVFMAAKDGGPVAALPIAQVLACGEQGSIKLNPPAAK